MLYPVASRIAGSFNRVWARACWLLATAVQAARPLSLPFSGGRSAPVQLADSAVRAGSDSPPAAAFVENPVLSCAYFRWFSIVPWCFLVNTRGM